MIFGELGVRPMRVNHKLSPSQGWDGEPCLLEHSVPVGVTRGHSSTWGSWEEGSAMALLFTSGNRVDLYQCP